MSRYTKLGWEIGKLVESKNEAYGASFAKAGEFLALLWPKGLPPERYDDALLLVRIFDKQMRIATDRDAFGESPYRDIAGYGLLGAALHEEKDAERERGCGTASAAAEDGPKGQHASQPRSVPPQTTTSAAATKLKSTSGGCFPPHARFSLNAALQAAFAQTATASAPGEEADRQPPSAKDLYQNEKLVWLTRNSSSLCAFCTDSLRGEMRICVGYFDGKFEVHEECAAQFVELIQMWKSQMRTEVVGA